MKKADKSKGVRRIRAGVAQKANEGPDPRPGNPNTYRASGEEQRSSKPVVPGSSPGSSSDSTKTAPLEDNWRSRVATDREVLKLLAETARDVLLSATDVSAVVNTNVVDVVVFARVLEHAEDFLSRTSVPHPTNSAGEDQFDEDGTRRLLADIAGPPMPNEKLRKLLSKREGALLAEVRDDEQKRAPRVDKLPASRTLRSGDRVFVPGEVSYIPPGNEPWESENRIEVRLDKPPGVSGPMAGPVAYFSGAQIQPIEARTDYPEAAALRITRAEAKVEKLTKALASALTLADRFVPEKGKARNHLADLDAIYTEVAAEGKS